MTVANFEIYFESMAGFHLADSVRALRDAGSPDALYDPLLRLTDRDQVEYEDYSMASDIAHGESVSYSRRALLFAAFAAEAYANDFLYEKRSGQDRAALQKLSTVDKYAILPGLTGAVSTLSRAQEPLQKLKWLFQRRDELVHAAPKGKDLTYDPVNHNPRAAAESIVAVTDAAVALHGAAPKGSILSRALARRQALLEYGARSAASLPGIHDSPSPLDLLR
jgi:hypothetical protein